MPQASHYFTPQAPARAATRTVELRLRDRALRFRTAPGVFARSSVDRGTRLLLEAADLGGARRILDLGCGYGAMGIVAAAVVPQARVVLVDINPRAVALAQENIALNRLANAEARCGDGCAPVAGEQFDLVLFNPPIRAGRNVVLRLLGEAHACLRPGGRLYFVARTQQGARTLGRRMGETYAEVREVARGGGFRVFEGCRV
ncbi:MAG: class I SAM-dependent methyltransferase [Bacillati bacterium ANGP1]|uniref:Class I SAM-dependent methyltransferase n=1 Tax=Candidatus Segetimicrobium genomatis TaxID=2569760 RepID=A0A537JBL7_9BACT|nr:MAG: class I SAM-dependent methyltransferase [Terrabacteria group bacterium ANGP1]